MMESNLVKLSENLKVNLISEDEKTANFEIEGLYRGFGLTLGNALRRVLLSSLPGAAITSVKIKGVGHEFTTIPGVMEDVVEVCLNLKKVRFTFHPGGADSEILVLKTKGEGAVTAADIKGSSAVEVVNKDLHIATISQKGTEVEMELTVEKGLGYVPVESFKTVTLPVGVIQLDALFSPVTKVNFTVENMRVGDKTDFNRLKLMIETDGGVKPAAALAYALTVINGQFSSIASQVEAIVPVVEPVEAEGEEKKKPAKKAAKKKKEE
jgi:DNA-directed RNA polymerase subunit alpha